MVAWAHVHTAHAQGDGCSDDSSGELCASSKASSVKEAPTCASRTRAWYELAHLQYYVGTALHTLRAERVTKAPFT